MCCVFFSFFSHSFSFYLSRIDHLNSHLKFVLYNIFGWYHRNKNNKILIESFTTSCYIPKSHFYTDRCDVILRLKVYSIALIVCVFLLVLSPGDLIESAENVRRIQSENKKNSLLLEYVDRKHNEQKTKNSWHEPKTFEKCVIKWYVNGLNECVVFLILGMLMVCKQRTLNWFVATPNEWLQVVRLIPTAIHR